MEDVKSVVVGDGAVGKTCLLIAYTSDSYDDTYIPTIFDTYSTNLMLDATPVNLNLWDTAGQEDYDRLRPLSYPDTDVFLVCFSIASRHSFRNVQAKWLPEVQFYSKSAPIVLVGLQKDRRPMRHAGDEFVTFEEANALAQEMGCAAYVECSSKTGEGVKHAFDSAVRLALSTRKQARRASRRAVACSIL